MLLPILSALSTFLVLAPAMARKRMTEHQVNVLMKRVMN